MTDLSSVRRELRREQRQLNLRRFLRNRQAVFGSLVLLTMLFIAVFAPLLAPADPLAQTVSNRFAKPGTAGYLLGADKLGRDLLSRILYGARVSMTVGLSVGLSSMLLGMTVGLYAAWYRTLDNILMRICDGLSAIPSTLLAIALMAVLGSSTFNVILALSIVYIPRMARISRSAALVVKEQTFIEALQSQGAGTFRILWVLRGARGHHQGLVDDRLSRPCDGAGRHGYQHLRRRAPGHSRPAHELRAQTWVKTYSKSET